MFNKLFSKKNKKYAVGVDEEEEKTIPELQSNDIFTSISSTFSNFNSIKTISKEENIKLLEEPQYKFLVFPNFEDEEYNTEIKYCTTTEVGNNLNRLIVNESECPNIILINSKTSKIPVSKNSGEQNTCDLNATIFLSKFSAIVRLNMYGLLKDSQQQYRKLNSIFECLIKSKKNLETLKYINVGGNNIKPIKQSNDTYENYIDTIRNFKNFFSTDLKIEKNNFKNNDEVEKLLDELEPTKYSTTVKITSHVDKPDKPDITVEEYINSENFTSDHCFVKIVTVWPKLEELNISNNQIDDFYILQKILGSKIKKINVANNNIINDKNPTNYNALLQSLFENYIITGKHCESLNIIGNNFDIARIVRSLGMKNSQLTKISIEKISRPIFEDLINNIKNKNIKYLSIPNTVINNIPVISIEDKYMTNYTIKEYLQKYLYHDTIEYFSNPQIQSYIHHLNDETLGNQSILIKNLTLAQRKYKLLDIINFHKILMSLTPYEAKILLSTMKSYTVNSISSGTSKSNALSGSIELGNQGISGAVGYTREKGETKNVIQSLTSSAPWEQYGIDYNDAAIPIKLLNTAILANNNSTSDFQFFNNNKNNLKIIIDKLQFTKELCQMIKISSSLQNLNLSYCKINNFTIKKICESLKHNITLKSINLSNNDFDIDCWHHIINFIENPFRSVIENFNLLDNDTNDKNTISNLSNSLIVNNSVKVFYYNTLAQDFYSIVNDIRSTLGKKKINFLKNNNPEILSNPIKTSIGGKLNNNYVKTNKENIKKYSKKKNKKVSRRKNKKLSKRKNKKLSKRKNKKLSKRKNKKLSKRK